MTSIQAEHWSLDRIRASEHNAKLHPPDQVAAIAASIKEFGFTLPLLVDETGELIAGHGTALAAGTLGLVTAPVIVARGWTEGQIRAYRIADNKLALNSGWDFEKLSLELHDLADLAFDPTLTGFSLEEIAELTKPPAAPPKSTELAAAAVNYNIVFDDESQQGLWFELLRQLKERYPERETIGARLVAFIADEPG